MKKLSILFLSIFLISNFNINAQTEGNQEKDANTEQVKKECPVTKNTEGELICAKTGEVCEKTCENKKTNSCCKGKKAKSSCNKSNKGSFNFNKSNNYGKTSSCSKAKTKKCCKSKAQKSDTTEGETTEGETDKK